jgi:hypothetical protein
MRDWLGFTTVVVASGHSLCFDQVSQVMGSRKPIKVIAVNRAYQMVGLPDIVYAGDFMFWKTYHAEIRRSVGRFAELWTMDSAAHERFGINRVRGCHREGLGRDGRINSHGNSGMQAIDLAFQWGSRRILLLGFDMRLGPEGQKRFHGDHEAALQNQGQLFGEWLHKGHKLAAELKQRDCEVVNCTPGSAWTDFPFSTIDKELA